jgi:hypothetical protein
MAIPVGSADWRCGAKRKGAAMPPLPLRIDEVIERAFRTAAFDGRKVSLWVTCGRRPGKNFLTFLQHWSGAVTCPAC